MGVHVYILRSVGLIVHKQKIQIAHVVDEESLMAGWHHMASLLVVAVSDLSQSQRSAPPTTHITASCDSSAVWFWTHLRHSSLPLKPSPHPIIDALRLPPAGVDAFEAVG